MIVHEGNREWYSAEYAETLYRRATGELPEMECSKAVATILAPEVQADDSVLDVGCGVGHYLRSLRNRIRTPFSYTGVDATTRYIDQATRAWGSDSQVSFQVGDVFALRFPDREFDVVMCNNLLHSLPSIVAPVHELVRVARKLVILRALVGQRSFRIREVFSTATHPSCEVPAEREFADDGEPVSFGYLNIYSKRYLCGVLRRAAPAGTIEFIEDRFFDGAAINRSAESEGVPNPTRVIDGRQVFGDHIILPWCFVVVRFRERAKELGP